MGIIAIYDLNELTISSWFDKNYSAEHFKNSIGLIYAKNTEQIDYQSYHYHYHISLFKVQFHDKVQSLESYHEVTKT